jgi:hypothetical protein
MNIQTFIFLVICVLVSRAIRTFRLRNKEQNSIGEEISEFIVQLFITTLIYLIIYHTLIFIF